MAKKVVLNYLEKLYENEKKEEDKVEVECVGEQVEEPEDEKKNDDSVVDEGIGGDIAKTAVGVAGPLVGGAVGGLPGSFVGTVASQTALQAINRRQAAKAAQAQQVAGADATEKKYEELAKQRSGQMEKV